MTNVIHKAVILALGCLLLGFELGAISKALEPSQPAHTLSVKVKPASITGFALTACLGSEIPNARGGKSVIFEPGEC